MSLKKTVLGLAVLSFANLVAEPIKPKEPDPEWAHHFRVGPEIFRANYKHSSETTQGKFTGIYIGPGVQYEYIRSNELYGGFDFLYAPGRETYNIKTTYEYPFGGKTEYLSRARAKISVLKSEGRVGYCYSPIDMFKIVSFVGIGTTHIGSLYNMINVYPFYNSYEFDVSSDRAHYSFGIRPSVNVSKCLSLGFNAKGIHTFYGSVRKTTQFGEIKEKIGNQFGMEFGVPFRWHSCMLGNWDIQIEPYYSRLDAKDNLKIFGGRVSTAYSF